MRILLTTGAATEDVVKSRRHLFDADVVVTGEIASFLTPHMLHGLIKKGSYDMVIVPGMCTASFEQVEQETGVPVYRGPRHAADLAFILPLLGTVTLSRTIPADDFLAANKAGDARKLLDEREKSAECDFIIRGTKIGGTSRMKVLAEVMDAHLREDIREIVEQYFAAGADIVDLGFGFDAVPADVTRVFSQVEDIDRILAVDTQEPDLIRAALVRADLVLSPSGAKYSGGGRRDSKSRCSGGCSSRGKFSQKESRPGKKERYHLYNCRSSPPACRIRSCCISEKFQKIRFSAFLWCR